MAYKVDWFIDQRIIRADLTDEVSINEIALLRDEATKLIEDGIPLVHLIIDVSQITKHPNLFELRSVIRNRDPAAGWILIVGANPMIQVVISIIMQMTNIRFRLLSGFDAALDFLQTKDKTVAV